MPLNNDPVRRTVTRRLRNIYEATPDDVREKGMAWYSQVHDAALKEVGGKSGRTVKHAAGVIAAVSPNMDWEKNNIGAFDEISSLSGRQWDTIRASAATPGRRTEEAAAALKGLSISTSPDSNLIKAHRIWHGGEDFDDVLSRRTAPKTNSFAHNIWQPHKEGPVTIDGRQADIIVDSMRPWGGQGSSRGINSADSKYGKPTRYENFEDHTRAVAAQYGILPHQFQAVTWEGAKPIERGFDSNRKQGDMRVGQSYQSRLAHFQAGQEKQ